MRKKLRRLRWKLIWKLRKRRFCRNIGYRCPDCIFHDFVLDGSIFRGNMCRYPRRY